MRSGCGAVLVLLALGCSGPPIPRDQLPSDPIAFMVQKASEGSASLDELRAALRIESPADKESQRPQLKTVLSLLVPSTGEVQPVHEAQPGDVPLDWSADGHRLLVGRFAGGTRRLELVAWNRLTGAWNRLVPDVAVAGATFSDGPMRAAWGARVPTDHDSWTYGVRVLGETGAISELAGGRGGLDPDLSPDGRSVVFVRPPQRAGAEGVILLASSDGGEPRPLGRGASPRFSRDGRWIAFTRQRGDTHDVWLMRADGTGRRAITDSALQDEEDPCVSPDGGYVAYASARGARGESQLYVTRVRDRREMQLTSRGQNLRPVW